MGVVDEGQLDKVLEFHKRDIVPTFGTNSSQRVRSKKTAFKQKLSTDDYSGRPSHNQPGSDQTESDHTVTSHQVG